MLLVSHRIRLHLMLSGSRRHIVIVVSLIDWRQELLNRFLEPALTVDQELSGCDDVLPVLETLPHLDPSLARIDTEDDLARFEATF